MLHVKPKLKYKVDNKIKAYGDYDEKTGIAKINVKKHKGDKKQLADTIRHEKYHHDHPKAKERSVNKNTGTLENMTKQEQDRLLAKLRMRKINYTHGAVKRKLHMKGEAKPGDLITKMNEQRSITNNNQQTSKTILAIKGLV